MNTIDWGQAAVNNTIGFGQAPTNNTIDFGEVCADSWSPETNLTGAGATPSYQNEYSFQFDGVDDYIDCGDNDNLSFGDSVTDLPFSISAWVKMNSSSGFRIISKYGIQQEYILAFNSGSTANKLVFQLFDKVNTVYISKRSVNTYQSLEGTWAHIVATYNGNSSNSGMNLYINNTNISTVNNNVGSYVAMHNTAAPLEIGKLSTNYADGLIDEVSIFNSELSASDVTTIYNSGIPNNLNDLSTPPLSWWRMGEAATFDGIRDWNLVDQGTGGNDATSQNIAETERVTDVPT